MKQAVLITAYAEPLWLKEICEVYQKYFRVYIHYDAKSKDLEGIGKLAQLDGVRLISRYKINWGSYKHILAIMDLMRMAMEDGCEYVHIISGNTIPVIHPKEIVKFFDAHAENIFMSFFYRESTKNYRYGAWYFEHIFNKRGKGIGRIYSFVENKIIRRLADIPIRKGFELPCYSYVYSHFNTEAADYIIKYYESHPDFMRQIKYCFVPEELFFCNIIEKSRFRSKVIDDHYIFHIWNKERGFPAFLNQSDFEAITTSGRMFARKVSYDQRELFADIRKMHGF